MDRKNKYSGVTVADVCQNRSPVRDFHRDAQLTTVFADHRGQKFFGKESPAKASLTRIKHATYKPVAEGCLRSYTSLLHTIQRGGKMGVVQLLPHEQTSDHDDVRLSVMEEPVVLYPEPLDADRLFQVYRIPIGEFPLSIGEPTPRYPSLPRRPGSCRTFPFYHAPQPTSPPGAVDYLVPLSPRTLVEELLVISTSVEVSRNRKRLQYHGNGR